MDVSDQLHPLIYEIFDVTGRSFKFEGYLSSKLHILINGTWVFDVVCTVHHIAVC